MENRISNQHNLPTFSTAESPLHHDNELYAPIIETAKALYLKAQTAAKVEVAQLRKERDDTIAKMKALQAELSESHNIRDYLQEELNQEREAHLTTQERHHETQVELALLKNKAKEEHSALTAQIASLTKEHEAHFISTTTALTKKTQEQKLLIARLSTEKENLLLQLDRADLNQTEFTEEKKRLKSKIQNLESEVLSLQHSAARQTTELNDTLSELEQTRSEVSELKTHSTDLERQKKSMQEELFDTWMDHKPDQLAIENALSQPSSLSSLMSFPLKEDLSKSDP